jgi:ubiquinone/menaquinone biosynthesis C-methylase UbiE
MSNPISDRNWWRNRLHECRGELHRSICECSIDRWLEMQAEHQRTLAKEIRPTDVILDVGCAWGRIVGLLPCTFKGMYVGVDSSPEMITLAQMLNPPWCTFYVQDVRCMTFDPGTFTVAIACGMRGMFQRNRMGDAWLAVQNEMNRVAMRQLVLPMLDE